MGATTSSPRTGYRSAFGWIAGELVEDAYVELDGDGTIVRAEGGFADRSDSTALVEDLGRVVLLPGMVNAHSHAFQRGIRGQTQARRATDPSSFWSWREAMYAAANRLDPEEFHAVTRAAFEEMIHAGITAVGEFHYLHHGPDGRAYADHNELSHQVVRAAESVGIRLVLLEVYYARGGPGREASPEQRRFCDGSVEAYFERVDSLRREGVDVGIAPHSVRAVGRDDLRQLATFANDNGLVMHAHVSEQPAENEACREEYGLSPAQVLADAGCLDRARAFTAVHAIHITEDDRALLSEQTVCACPTTEADLGDGIVRAGELHGAGAVLALGSDSNAVIDLIQEARLLEMNERLRTQARLQLSDPSGRVAPVLIAAATVGGAVALGQQTRLGTLEVGRPFDAFSVSLDHSTLDGIAPELAVDALFTAGTAASVEQVFVAGRRVV